LILDAYAFKNFFSEGVLEIEPGTHNPSVFTKGIDNGIIFLSNRKETKVYR